MDIRNIERFQMQNLERIIKSTKFKTDLKEIESYIQNNYQKLHYHWGIKNKLKLAAERLVRFHIWKGYALVDLYNTPLSSDVAFIYNDCVMNIDCKTIDLSGNSGDKIYIQCEQNQANFENINLYLSPIPNTDFTYEGVSFYPTLEKFHQNKPVLSYFIFINYFDNGNSFKIKELEICCLPHNESVKNDFNSNIIQNFKTYKYLKDNQAIKFSNYYQPVKNPKPHWVEFKIGSKKYYYDNKMSHPFDNNKLLVWSLVAGKWHVLIGGHTIRVKKDLIENRIDDNNNKWKGWIKVAL